MNRAARRIAQLSQRREMRHLSRGFDPERPLDFRPGSGGYVHLPFYCKNHNDGGTCDRPNQPGLGYFCNACQTFKPVGEFRRSRKEAPGE